MTVLNSVQGTDISTRPSVTVIFTNKFPRDLTRIMLVSISRICKKSSDLSILERVVYIIELLLEDLSKCQLDNLHLKPLYITPYKVPILW